MKLLTPKDVLNLQQGTKLVLIDDTDTLGFLTKGKTYTFLEAVANRQEIRVSESCFSWRTKRFALVRQAPVRDRRGRFISPKLTLPKDRVKPAALRFGSLYAVKRKRGYQIARLRTSAHQDILVFSRHKKPFLARRNQVALADKTEVESYLREVQA